MFLDDILARDSRCGPGNLAAYSPRGRLVRLGLKRGFWPPMGGQFGFRAGKGRQETAQGVHWVGPYPV